MGFGSRGGFALPGPAVKLPGIARTPTPDTPSKIAELAQEKAPTPDTPTFTTSVS